MGQTCDLIINITPATVIADGTTDFGGFTGPTPGKLITFTISLSASVKLYVRSGAVNSVFNADVALAANAVYTFTFIARPATSYTFRLSAAATVNDMVGVSSLE